MAGSGVTLYSTTASGNKAVIGTIDWREDVYMPSQINDNVAQIMADMRAMANAVATGWIEIGDGDGTYTATYVSATSFRFDGVNVASYYRAGMRVRVVAPTPGTLSGTITSSTFSTHTTLVVAWDSGLLSNEAITSVSLGVGSGGAGGAQPSYRNILGRNGGFEVWQRGAGGSADFNNIVASTYTADGWYFSYAGATSRVLQQPGLTSGSRYSAYVQRNSGQTATSATAFEYPLDADEIAQARGGIVTVSMTLVAGADFSPAGKIINVILFTGTGAAAKRASGAYTGEATPINTTQAITTNATRYTFTATAAVGASVTQASLWLSWTPVGTAGAQDLFAIDDGQLEIGSATPFERRPYEQELAACERHYEKTFGYATAPAQNVGSAVGCLTTDRAHVASGVGSTPWQFRTAKRTSPTITTFNPLAANVNYRNSGNSADYAATVSFGNEARALITAAAMASGDYGLIHAVADAGI